MLGATGGLRQQTSISGWGAHVAHVRWTVAAILGFL